MVKCSMIASLRITDRNRYRTARRWTWTSIDRSRQGHRYPCIPFVFLYLFSPFVSDPEYIVANEQQRMLFDVIPNCLFFPCSSHRPFDECWLRCLLPFNFLQSRMKFAEHLSAHVTPEWNSQYIRYDDMKELLAQAVIKAQPFVDESDQLLREEFFSRVDEHFFQVEDISLMCMVRGEKEFLLVLRKRSHQDRYVLRRETRRVSTDERRKTPRMAWRLDQRDVIIVRTVWYQLRACFIEQHYMSYGILLVMQLALSITKIHWLERAVENARSINCLSLSRALRRWEKLKTEVNHMEKASRFVSQHSAPISSRNTTVDDPLDTTTVPSNEKDKSSKLKRRPVHPDESSLMGPLVRVLPDRLIEKTRAKKSERNHYRKCNDLKLAFSEFYLMLVLLQNYQTLNYTGFRKILKKHDKLFQTTRGEEWRSVDDDRDFTRSFSFHLENCMSILLHSTTRNGWINWSTMWKPCTPTGSNRATGHEPWNVYAFHR